MVIEGIVIKVYSKEIVEIDNIAYIPGKSDPGPVIVDFSEAYLKPIYFDATNLLGKRVFCICKDIPVSPLIVLDYDIKA